MSNGQRVRPNQKLIADNLGLSQQAVSFALNGSPKISQKTRELVQAEAERVGYRLNPGVRLMKSGGIGNIALVTRKSFHTLPNLLLSGLNPVLKERGILMSLFGAEESDFADTSNLPRLFRESVCDGILALETGGWTTELTEVVNRLHIPTIWINRKLQHNAVYPDERYLASRLAEEVLSRYSGTLGDRDRCRILYFGSTGWN